MEDAVRIAVVDDVQGEQEKLCNLLLGYAARKGCRWEINRFSSGEAFLADTEREHRYNLVFLDILMNGIDGLETAKRLRKKDPQALIVFVTTEADYAVEGYEVEAAGFLVKGGEHSRERLERLMIRLERKLQHDAMFDLSAYHPAVKFPVGTLLYAEVRNHCMEIHARSGVYALRMPLEELKRALPEDGRFFECHRGVLLNLDVVASIGGDAVSLNNGERLPVSRRRRLKLEQAYAAWNIAKARSGL